MENASKALIIAGAILISILIIGLGVFIYQKVSTQVDSNTDLSEYTIQAFNNKFEKYLGNSVKGSTVSSLVSIVNANNGTNSQKVVLEGAGIISGSKETGYSANVSSGSTYKVTVPSDGGRTNGYIAKITISE